MLEEGLTFGESYNHMQFLFTGRWFYKWHGGWGGGGYLEVAGGGWWAYNRLFTLCELLSQAPYVTD